MENEAVGADVLVKAEIQHTREFARSRPLYYSQA